MEKKSGISIRGFVSLLLLFCSVPLALSGIFLFTAPQCWVAEEISWTMMGLAKDQWASVHMTFALVFLIVAVVHIVVYNWKPLVGHMKPGKRKQALSMRPELLVALVIAVIFLVGAALIILPFSLLPDTHDAIQRYYREKPEVRERDRDGRRDGRHGRGVRNSEIPRPFVAAGIIITPVSATRSDGALEPSFQQAGFPGDHGGAAMGAGVGVVAGEKLVDDHFHLGRGE